MCLQLIFLHFSLNNLGCFCILFRGKRDWIWKIVGKVQQVVRWLALELPIYLGGNLQMYDRFLEKIHVLLMRDGRIYYLNLLTGVNQV